VTCELTFSRSPNQAEARHEFPQWHSSTCRTPLDCWTGLRARTLGFQVATRRLLEAPLESTSEAGGMFISYGAGDHLDAHVGMCEVVGCLQQSLLREQTPQAQSSALLKQVLKTRFAQVAFQSRARQKPGSSGTGSRVPVGPIRYTFIWKKDVFWIAGTLPSTPRPA
jgi:hypothetical protein